MRVPGKRRLEGQRRGTQGKGAGGPRGLPALAVLSQSSEGQVGCPLGVFKCVCVGVACGGGDEGVRNGV